jgi:hypothetical protein
MPRPFGSLDSTRNSYSIFSVDEWTALLLLGNKETAWAADEQINVDKKAVRRTSGVGSVATSWGEGNFLQIS